MIGSLIDIALFSVVLFILLPLLIYSVYLRAFTKNLHDRGYLRKSGRETRTSHLLEIFFLAAVLGDSRPPATPIFPLCYVRLRY
jgi:di/tricarboxylate transporter